MINALKASRIKPKEAIGSAEYALELIKGRGDESTLKQDLNDFIEAAKHSGEVYAQAVAETEKANDLLGKLASEQGALAREQADFKKYEKDTRADLAEHSRKVSEAQSSLINKQNKLARDIESENERVKANTAALKAREDSVSSREVAVERREVLVSDRERSAEAIHKTLTAARDGVKNLLAGI